MPKKVGSSSPLTMAMPFSVRSGHPGPVGAKSDWAQAEAAGAQTVVLFISFWALPGPLAG